jgi:hypothetical protein
MSVAAFKDVLPLTDLNVLAPSIQVITQEVAITFEQVEEIWTAQATPSAINLAFGDVASILWTLIPPQVEGREATVSFDSPPLSFPPDQALAPMQIMSLPNSRQAVAMWSNINSVTKGTYKYFIHALVDGHQVKHDPTVQNDPPPPGP